MRTAATATTTASDPKTRAARSTKRTKSRRPRSTRSTTIRTRTGSTKPARPCSGPPPNPPCTYFVLATHKDVKRDADGEHGPWAGCRARLPRGCSLGPTCRRVHHPPPPFPRQPQPTPPHAGFATVVGSTVGGPRKCPGRTGQGTQGVGRMSSQAASGMHFESYVCATTILPLPFLASHSRPYRMRASLLGFATGSGLDRRRAAWPHIASRRRCSAWAFWAAASSAGC